MRLIELTCVGLAVIGASLSAARTAAAQERAPGVRRLVLELEVDVAQAREQNWAGKDATDEQLVAIGSRLVQRRFDAMQRAPKIELEPGTKRFTISLPSIDSRERELFTSMLASIGLCEFLFVADEESAKAREINFALERARLMLWRQDNADEPLTTFNLLGPDEKGPATGLTWLGTAFGDQPLAVLLPENPADHVGAGSFARVYPGLAADGSPAVGFELNASRTEDFERVTEANVGQLMAIACGGTILLAPKIKAKLSGGGYIEDGLKKEDTERWIDAFQKLEGPLRIVEPR